MKVRTLQSSLLLLIGAGILAYNLMNFAPATTRSGPYGEQFAQGKHYRTAQKVWGGVGAALIVLGLYVENRRRSSSAVENAEGMAVTE